MKDALDRFAHAFINPLLRQSSIDREVNPVDTEFLESTSKDDHRLEQFLTLLTKKGHPLSTFSWGNKVSLVDKTREAGIDLRQRLVDFWNEYYRAENMTLAIQAQTDFKTLESWVQVFSQIPSGLKVPAEQRPTRITSPPYEPSLHHRVYFVKPVSNTHRLHISWSLPPAHIYYKVKPLDFLASLIGHEGKGSVASYLRRQGLILDISAGNDLDCGSNCHHNKFTLDITLTEEGLKEMGRVVQAVFVYIKMLRIKGPQRKLYDEEALINQIEVRFEEETTPNISTKDVARRSFFYKTPHLLLGSRLYMEYQDNVINYYLQRLVPSDANFIIFSSTLLKDADYDSREPWMNIPYRVQSVPKEWLIEDDKKVLTSLFMPSPNKFIPKKFTLVGCDHSSDYPQLVVENKSYSLWFLKNTTFKAPKTYVYFVLKSPVSRESAKSAAILDIFLGCLSLNMSEDLYPASCAGLDYSVTVSDSGLVFQFEGWSEVMEKFVELFMDHLSEFKVEKKTFKAVKDKIKQGYQNLVNDVERLGRGLKYKILEPVYWTGLDKLNVVDGITVDDLHETVDSYFKTLFMECLIEGNVHEHQAKDMAKYIRDSLGYKILEEEEWPKLQTHELPSDSDTFVRVGTFDRSAKNSFITNFYQIGRFEIRDFCRLELFSNFMYERCFDFLRTKHSLGYSVTSSQHNLFGYGGWSITVLSPADKFSCSQVEEKIEEFLHKSFAPFIESMSEETFSQMTQSLIEQKEGPDLYLKEEVDRNWHEIALGDYTFNRLQIEVENLKELKLIEFKRWACHVIRSGRRKLSVQVIGSGKVAQDDSVRISARKQATHEVNYTYYKPSRQTSERENYINNVEQFKSSLPLNPINRTSK